MADILVRGLNPQALRRLKARAKQNGRSLQGEAKLLLERAAGADSGQVVKLIAKWEKKFASRKLTSSADMIRQDRTR
ncbi:MAG: hypothetical protein EHM48_04820 [Planctomycetaceae bacterium]|nr:MAG: hypothetical protein EHM48_04820 [Planctomycetaceae bacterium]